MYQNRPVQGNLLQVQQGGLASTRQEKSALGAHWGVAPGCRSTGAGRRPAAWCTCRHVIREGRIGGVGVYLDQEVAAQGSVLQLQAQQLGATEILHRQLHLLGHAARLLLGTAAAAGQAHWLHRHKEACGMS